MKRVLVRAEKKKGGVFVMGYKRISFQRVVNCLE